MAAPPIRVLHVAQPTAGGVARVVRELVRLQSGAGARAVVACPDGPLRRELLEGGDVTYLWPAVRSPLRNLPAEAARLRAIVAEFRPDVVHLHSSKAGLVGRATIRGRIPTIFQPHAWSDESLGRPADRLARRWERFAQRFATEIVCVSAAEAAHGRALGIRRSTIVPNGVDLARWVPVERDEARRRLGLPADLPVAVCVGRLCHQKGQDLLLRAWPQVLRAVPRARLVLVGDGPDRAALGAAAAGLPVQVVEGCADPRLWYAAADVTVMPSRWEGGPLVLLEAMAMARPVVGFDVGGLGATVADARAVLPEADVAGLAALVAQRLLDRDLAAREGRANRAAVEARHDVVDTSDALLALATRCSRAGAAA